MTAEEKIATHRLSVLQLAQVLGNISEACIAVSSTSSSVGFRRTVWRAQGSAPDTQISSHDGPTPDYCTTLKVVEPWPCGIASGAGGR